jgi:hypothetical protein
MAAQKTKTRGIDFMSGIAILGGENRFSFARPVYKESE